MKNVRKGFTLIELLIVIMIIGALSATMMLSTTSGIAAAKASTIITNMNIMKDAALLFYMDSADANPTIAAFNARSADYLGEMTSLGGLEGFIVISYPEEEDNTGVQSKWYVACSFDSDPDKVAIAERLASRAKSSRLLGSIANYSFGESYISQQPNALFVKPDSKADHVLLMRIR